MLEIIEKFSKANVLVIGDLMLDEYIWGNVERISPEAPVPVVNIKDRTYHLGGAANVINNIVDAGGDGYVVGVIGGDPQARAFTKLLSKSNISQDGIIQYHEIPTTHKIRVMAQNQQLIRIDNEDVHNDKAEMEKALLAKIKQLIKGIHVVVLSDYGKGVISKNLISEVIKLCLKQKIKIVVDPKINHFDLYQDVDVITPNHVEAEKASGIKIKKEEDLKLVANALLKKTKAKSILITLGEKGMILYENGKKPHHIPTVAREVYDVSGAGDTVVALMALSMAAGADLITAAAIANQAAGIVVGKLGVATVEQDELIKAIKGEDKKKK